MSKRKQPLYVVLDTSAWLALLRAGDIAEVLDPVLSNGQLRLVTSDTLDAELFEVAARAEHRRKFPLELLQGLYRSLYAARFLRKMLVGPVTPACADPTDDFLFALCRDAKPRVRVLVSRDRQVLDGAHLPGFQHVRFQDVRQFRAWCREAGVA